MLRHEKGRALLQGAPHQVPVRGPEGDLKRYGISRGELASVLRSVSLDDLVDPKHPDAALLRYLARQEDKVEKLLEDPTLLRTPIVRNGKQATVGYQPDVWKGWE